MKTLFILTLLQISLFQSMAQAATNFDSPACKKWQNFMGAGDNLSADSLHSDSMVVMDGSGKQIYSWSDGAFKKSSPHILWSVSKSVTSAVVASAIQSGKITLDQKIYPLLADKIKVRIKDPANFQKITFANLLSMTSGLQWQENEDGGLQKVPDFPMMFSGLNASFAEFIAQIPFAGAPGSVWSYSTANADLAMTALRSVYGDDYDKMPWKNLFDGQGMTSAVWERDRSGVFAGGSSVYLSVEDMAKFGLLYLDDGVNLKGQRIFPEGWVKFAKELTPTSVQGLTSAKDFKDIKGPYSKASFWLNADVPGLGRPFPNGPPDMMLAAGLFGQWILILPSQNIVFARTGHDELDKIIDMFDPMIMQTVECLR